MKKVALIFGGTSAEYEVSLASAASVLEALLPLNYEVTTIGINQKGNWFLTKSDAEELRLDRWQQKPTNQEIFPHFNGKGFWLSAERKFFQPDILFPILHGGAGEDGRLQGIFEQMALPYVGCGVSASAICMNKFLLHQFAKTVGINSTPTLLIDALTEKEKISEFVELHGLPLFVKPNEAGSSKGITKITSLAELDAALSEAFNYCQQIILQKAVDGIEIGCGILGNQELVIGECDEIALAGDFFNYVEKYQLLTAKINVPANISTEKSDEIKRQAQLLYRLLGCKGLARLDFFLTETGEILLNEVNTMPGFTAHSRYSKMFAATNISYPEIIERLLTLAEEDHHEKQLLAAG